MNFLPQRTASIQVVPKEKPLVSERLLLSLRRPPYGRTLASAPAGASLDAAFALLGMNFSPQRTTSIENTGKEKAPRLREAFVISPSSSLRSDFGERARWGFPRCGLGLA